MKDVRQIHDPQLRETVHLGRTDSGVQVAVIPKHGFSTSAGYFGLRFGSTATRFRALDGSVVEVPEGSAHFLEHKLFEGREEKVFDRFGKIGADFNGGTGFRSTNYYFVSAGRFEEGLDILLDFVQHPLITEERVEKEKGIIEQEVRMYEDNPDFRSVFMLHRALYAQHPIRIPPGGFVDTVRATTAAHLQQCYDAFYRPENLVLSLAGELDPDAVFAMVEARLDPPNPGGGEALYPEEPPVICEARVDEEFPVSRPHVLVGWREKGGVGLGEPMLRRRVLSSLAVDLAFDLSSGYHEELYRRGVVDDSFHAYYSDDADYGYAVAGGQTDDVEQFIGGVREAAARFVADGPRAEDVERLRRANWGSLVSGLQTPAALAGSVLASLLVEQRPFRLLGVLEEITVEEVAARARELFDPERSAVSVLQPPAA